MARFSEHDFLAWLSRRNPPDDRLRVPIGDDAAVLARADGDRLFAVDTVVEGVHVPSGPDAPEQLARKVVRANLSDMAAMGGRGDAAVLSLKLPRGADRTVAERVFDAVSEECRRHDVSLAGGDTVVGDGGLLITLAILGSLRGAPVTRRGAKPGEVVLVTGEFGGSLLGRHIDIEPRLREAARLVDLGPPTAMADVSDGLLRDLSNILEASGCGAVVRADAVPVSPDARIMAAKSGRTALDHALHDGEDFELVLTMPSRLVEEVLKDWKDLAPLSVIGEVVASGLWLEEDGRCRTVAAGGWDHGAEEGTDDA